MTTTRFQGFRTEVTSCGLYTHLPRHYLISNTIDAHYSTVPRDCTDRGFQLAIDLACTLLGLHWNGIHQRRMLNPTARQTERLSLQLGHPGCAEELKGALLLHTYFPDRIPQPNIQHIRAFATYPSLRGKCLPGTISRRFLAPFLPATLSLLCFRRAIRLRCCPRLRRPRRLRCSLLFRFIYTTITTTTTTTTSRSVFCQCICSNSLVGRVFTLTANPATATAVPLALYARPR